MQAGGFAGGMFAIYIPSPADPGAPNYDAMMDNPPYEIELPEGGMLGLDGLTEFIRPRVASPTLLTDITEWIRTFHGDGPLEDDFSLVRVHLC